MVSLKSLHSFGFDSCAKGIINISNVDDVYSLGHLEQPFIILGGGSNTAFVSDYQGLVLQVTIKGIEIVATEKVYRVTVGAGENWHGVLSQLMAQGIFGMENLALIPGTTGGAVVQNIGAYGVELAQFCESVRGIKLDTLSPFEYSAEDCGFNYRDSIFKQQPGCHVITDVSFCLPKDAQRHTSYGPLAKLNAPSAFTIFKQVMAIRQQKLPDPAVLGNAGSFFKNPVISLSQFNMLKQTYPDIPHYLLPNEQVKIPAAWLIEQLGFKEITVGDVGCHRLQPLVLVNRGKAEGGDLLTLARMIKQQVASHFAIELDNEVGLIGGMGEITL